MKFLAFSFLLIALVSCQIDLMDPASGRTIVPNTEAKIARKLYLDSQDERKIRMEERYNYNEAGRLGRLDRLTHDDNGTVRRYSYDTYSYNNDGKVASIYQYAVTIGGGSEVNRLTQVRFFSYPTTDLIIERFQYMENGVLRDINRYETRTRAGKPIQVTRFGFNNQQPVLQSTETYQYDLSGRLITLEYRDAMGKLTNTTRYTYKGRTAVAERVMPASETTRPYQSMVYDSRGRLIRQLNLGYYLGYSSFYSADDMRLSSYSIPTIVKFEYLD